MARSTPRRSRKERHWPTPAGRTAAAAAERGCTPAQLALAWLLARSPTMVPIPGTRSVAHLEENVAAAAIRLSAEEVRALAGG